MADEKILVVDDDANILEVIKIRLEAEGYQVTAVESAEKALAKAYRIQLGQNPVGPKMKQGDSRTPEGEYFICEHRPSTYHRGLLISYPNVQDARRGLEAGLISQKEFDEIKAAIKEGRCPPQNTKLGGLILVHGQLPEYTADFAR